MSCCFYRKLNIKFNRMRERHRSCSTLEQHSLVSFSTYRASVCHHPILPSIRDQGSDLDGSGLARLHESQRSKDKHRALGHHSVLSKTNSCLVSHVGDSNQQSIKNKSKCIHHKHPSFVIKGILTMWSEFIHPRMQTSIYTFLFWCHALSWGWRPCSLRLNHSHAFIQHKLCCEFFWKEKWLALPLNRFVFMVTLEHFFHFVVSIGINSSLSWKRSIEVCSHKISQSW